MRKLSLRPHHALALAACILFAAISSCATLDTTLVQSKPGTTTTLIIVRHCERDPGLDPPLNAEGSIRAQKLVEVCRENGVTAIYAPSLQRNQQSVQPLADALGIKAHFYSDLEMADTKAFANNFVNTVLANHAGEVVMWNGNTGPVTDTQSGNLQELYARLGGTIRAPVRYQDLFIAVIPDEGPVHFIKTEYGGPSSLD